MRLWFDPKCRLCGHPRSRHSITRSYTVCVAPSDHELFVCCGCSQFAKKRRGGVVW